MVRDARLKFTRELSDTLAIQSVSNDGIQINDELRTQTVALSPQNIFEDCPDKPVASLTIEDFSLLLDDKPELVLLGTGDKSEFPPRELVFAFARRGVGLETMDNTAAARTFNVLAGEGRRVAALFIQR